MAAFHKESSAKRNLADNIRFFEEAVVNDIYDWVAKWASQSVVVVCSYPGTVRIESTKTYHVIIISVDSLYVVSGQHGGTESERIHFDIYDPKCFDNLYEHIEKYG